MAILFDRMIARVAAFALVAMTFTAGCSKEEKKELAAQDATQCGAAAGAASGSGSAAGLTDCLATASGSGAAEVASGSGAKPTLAAGLFDYCQWAANDAGGCFTCTPRDLDLVKCVKDAKSGFDPSKDCHANSDLESLSCDVNGSSDWSWNLGEETKTEQLYGELPLVLAGAKLLLGGKLANDPVKKEAVLGVIDILGAHAKEIFNGGDLGAAAREIAVVVKKAKPALKDDELAMMVQAVTSISQSVAEKRKNGTFADADVLTLVAGFVTSLPSDVIGKEVGGFDVSTLAETLAGGGNLESLVSLLGSPAASASDATSASASDTTSGSGSGTGSATNTDTGSGS